MEKSDLENFNAIDKKRSKLFKKHLRVIGFLRGGTNKTFENYSSVIEVLSDVSDENAMSINIDFYGSDDLVGDQCKLDNLIKDYPLGEHIKINIFDTNIDFVSSMEDYDVLLNFSRNEGVSRAVVEAVLSGMLVFLNCEGGTNEVIGQPLWRHIKDPKNHVINSLKTHKLISIQMRKHVEQYLQIEGSENG
jgi:hypothetical protein